MSTLFTDGRAAKSKFSSVLIVGNFAALRRLSAARFSLSKSSSSSNWSR